MKSVGDYNLCGLVSKDFVEQLIDQNMLYFTEEQRRELEELGGRLEYTKMEKIDAYGCSSENKSS